MKPHFGMFISVFDGGTFHPWNEETNRRGMVHCMLCEGLFWSIHILSAQEQVFLCDTCYRWKDMPAPLLDEAKARSMLISAGFLLAA